MLAVISNPVYLPFYFLNVMIINDYYTGQIDLIILDFKSLGHIKPKLL